MWAGTHVFMYLCCFCCCAWMEYLHWRSEITKQGFLAPLSATAIVITVTSLRLLLHFVFCYFLILNLINEHTRITCIIWFIVFWYYLKLLMFACTSDLFPWKWGPTNATLCRENSLCPQKYCAVSNIIYCRFHFQYFIEFNYQLFPIYFFLCSEN